MTGLQTLKLAFGNQVNVDSLSLSDLAERIPFVDSITDIAEACESWVVGNWYTQSKDFDCETLTNKLRDIWLKKLIK